MKKTHMQTQYDSEIKVCNTIFKTHNTQRS